MFTVWVTVSTIVHPLRCFRPCTFFLKKRTGLVSMDFLHIIFTYYIPANQRGCFRLNTWFSWWCFGPLMNHLTPEWWCNVTSLFLNESWCVCLTSWRQIFYWCLVFIIIFMHCPNVTMPGNALKEVSMNSTSLWNQLVFHQRLQLFFQSPQPYLLIFAWRN